MPPNGLVSGDTASVYRVTCRDKDSGEVIDLTGSTVYLRWRNSAGDDTIERQMTVVGSPADGVAEYQFVADELFAPRMLFEVLIRNAQNQLLHSLDLLAEPVRRQLPNPAA